VSIALMTLAWKSGLPAGQKMVLLALCDNANDQGECYPSVPMLADKCSMAQRSVQRHLTDMEEVGILSRELRKGRSTLYHIDPRKFFTPDNLAPLTQSHPTPDIVSPPPPTQCHHTPATVSPITINEPSVEPSGKHQKARTKPLPLVAAVAFELPDWLPLDAWNGYLGMRQEKRKPPTDHAVKLLLADLAKWHAKGHDIAAALNASIRNGWTDVYEPKTLPAAQGAQLGAVTHLTKAGQATARNIEAWLEQKRQEKNHG